MKTRYNATSLSFGFYSPDEILSMSVAQIKLPFGFDSFNHPVPGGLYDARLGPLSERYPSCVTCLLNFHECPGHFGHIELKEMVYNPLNLDLLYYLLNSFCHHCKYFKINEKDRLLFFAELTLLKRGHLFNESIENLKYEENVTRIYESVHSILSDLTSTGFVPHEHHNAVMKFLKRVSTVKKCVNCKSVSSIYKRGKGKNIVLDGEIIFPCVIMHRLKNSCVVEEDILNMMFDGFSLNNFFIRYVLVTPNKFRPVTYMNGVVYESPHNYIFSKIIKINVVSDKIDVKSKEDVVVDIETDTASFYNNSRDDKKKGRRKGRKEILDNKSKPGYSDLGESDLSGNTIKDSLSIHSNTFGTSESTINQVSGICIDENSSLGNHRANTDSNCTYENDGSSSVHNNSCISNSIHAELEEIEPFSNTPKSINRNKKSLLNDENISKIKNTYIDLKKNNDLNKCSDMNEFSDDKQNIKKEDLNKHNDINSLNDDKQNNENDDRNSMRNKDLNSMRSEDLNKSSGIDDMIKFIGKKEKTILNEDASSDSDYIPALNIIDFLSLQKAILLFFDSSSKSSRDMSIGIKQKLEKKEGLFRRHMMGKRVNFAARSVISPDPHLHTREIGIPLIFAESLTFPEYVNGNNHEIMVNAVLNGPKYPGARYLTVKNPRHKTPIKYDLYNINERKRTELANRLLSKESIVHRHLLNDDIVLVNRQPTLHKPSIMAHRTRVLPGEKTIRMHYANCNSYNADFDGDEMNIHFLQDHLSRSEGYLCMSTDHNYLSTTNGNPVRGLVQDHIVVCSRLCLVGEFLGREEFLHYIAGCIVLKDNASGYLIHESNDIKNNDSSNTKRNKHHAPYHDKENNDNNFDMYRNEHESRFYVPDPTIIRPVLLYTGKQVITSILKSMNIEIDHTSKSKMRNLEEGKVIIRRGELLVGILDKNQIGPTNNSLVHACGEKYGYSICNELLTSFGRVINRVMTRQGYSARLDDLVLEKEWNEIRGNICRDGVESAIDASENIIYTTVEEQEDGIDPLDNNDMVEYTRKGGRRKDGTNILYDNDWTKNTKKVKKQEDGIDPLDNNDMVKYTRKGDGQEDGINTLYNNDGSEYTKKEDGQGNNIDPIYNNDMVEYTKKKDGQEDGINTLYNNDESEYTKKKEGQGNNTDHLSNNDKSEYTKKEDKQGNNIDPLYNNDGSEYTKKEEGQGNNIDPLYNNDGSEYTKKEDKQGNNIDTLYNNDELEYTKKEEGRENDISNNLIDPFYFNDANKLAHFDSIIKTKMNEVTSKIYQNSVSNGQYIPFPYNNMSLMINSGAKGSMVNLGQISGLLGQQELEGKRVPYMVCGSTLPCFKSNDMRPQVSGYIFGRFLDGINPSEYFFHCMAGREGLIDTAVKTSRSGYLQRCLIKSMEGVVVEYDMSVRNEGDIIQFLYGEDGCDPIKVVKKESLMINEKENSKEVEYIDEKKTKVMKNNQEVNYLDENKTKVIENSKEINYLDEKKTRAMKNNQKVKDINKKENKHNDYSTNKNDNESLKIDTDIIVDFKTFNDKNKQLSTYAICPGEAVGILAAQGVGEPSTQMTLNTFHLAGVGSRNVTLGIPRLVEILMVASKNIKTPVITTNLGIESDQKDHMSFEERKENILDMIKKKTLMDIVEKIKIEETKDHSFKIKIRFREEIKIEIIKRKLNKLIEKHIRKLDKLKYCGIEMENIAEDDIEENIDLEKINKGNEEDEESSDKESDQGSELTIDNTIKTNKEISEDYKDENESDSEHNDIKNKNEKKIINDSENESDVEGDQKSILEKEKLNDSESDIEGDKKSITGKERLNNSESDIEGDKKSIAGKERLNDSESDIEEKTRGKIKANVKLVDNDLKTNYENICDDDELIENSKRLNKIRRNKEKRKKREERKLDYEFCGEDHTIERFSRNLTIAIRMLNKNILILPIIEKILPLITIKEIQNIKGGTIIKDTLTIEGSDFCSLIEILTERELMETYSNDIHSVLQTLGIEAARSVIISEIKAVFDVYGIGIDVRHLMLIADFTTREGIYKPFSRFGMNYGKSILQKMSFESCFSFLREAVNFGTKDCGKNPSSCLIMGNNVKVGTAKDFDLIYEIDE